MKFDKEEIRKLQETDPHYAILVENINLKNERSKGDYSLDPHGTLYKKIKDNSLGHNGTTRSCQLLKRQYSWKGLKE